MSVQKFLVQVESGPGTRWQCGNKDLMVKMLKQVQGVVAGQTDGEVPDCSIQLAEQPAENALPA